MTTRPEYSKPNVHPDWDTAPLSGIKQLSHLMGHLGVGVVHREMLRAALPGRTFRKQGTGSMRDRTVRGEASEFTRTLLRLEKNGRIKRIGRHLLRVLDAEGMRNAAEQHNVVMPPDGILRARAWASYGETEMHEEEFRALDRLAQKFAQDYMHIDVVGHLDACPTMPNRGMKIIHKDMKQTWLPGEPVIQGTLWCWSHCTWEQIPQEWREEEKRLRERVLYLIRVSPAITEGLTKTVHAYCLHTRGVTPDLNDREELIRILHTITEERWV